MADPRDDARLARVEARLARERAARRESEDIAEATLRRLYLRQQDLDLLGGVTGIANGAQDAETALREAMELIRTATGWRAGHYFVPARDDRTVMVSSGVWSGASSDPWVEQARAATAGTRFPPGTGLPGMAYLHGAQWEPNFAGSSNFLRKRWLGGGSAFAFPILVGSEVVAVMEFLDPAPRPPQPALLELATVLGIQLGRVVERDRAGRREAEHRRALQDEVDRRTADLMVARDRAESQARARATLFATIGHDLSTPLHAAMAEVEAATDAADPRPVLARAAMSLQELQARLAALLDISGPTATSDDARPRVVDLARVLGEVVAAHAATSGLPAPEVELGATSSHPVLVDVDRFQRVVHTLLAARVVDGGDGVRRVRLEVRSAWAELVLDEPDVQAGTGRGDSSRGTLALAEQLTQAGGWGWTQGRLGDHGRRITVRMPVSVYGRARVGRGRAVLLVDDIAVTRQISAAMLARMGAEVHTAQHGAEAIGRLREVDAALVLMDLRMPVMDGLEATRRIRSGEAGPDRSEVPIVALTAHTAAGDADRSLLAGMDAHMGKPFTYEQLRSMVARYVPELAGSAPSPG